MSTKLQVVENRRQLREFIEMPYRIHRTHEKWVPPLYRDEWRYFDARKNAAFAHNDTVLLLAYEGGTPVGRIMGIINQGRNERLSERHARFGFLECS